MRINFKNLSILQQTYLLFGGFLILATVNYFVISHFKDKLSSYSQQLVELEYLEGQIVSMKENIDLVINDNAVAKDNLSSQLVNFEMELPIGDAGKKYFNATLIPVTDETSLVYGVIILIGDITNRLAVE